MALNRSSFLLQQERAKFPMEKRTGQLVPRQQSVQADDSQHVKFMNTVAKNKQTTTNTKKLPYFLDSLAKSTIVSNSFSTHNPFSINV